MGRPISQGKKPRFREVEQLTQGHTVILGIVKRAVDHFTQGVQKALQRRRQLSWAFNKHMPSAHHPQSKRCGHLRTKRGLPSTRFQLLEKKYFFLGGGEEKRRGMSLSRGLGRGQCRQRLGAGPSQVTSRPPSPRPCLHAFPQCPGWGWALVQAFLLPAETGAAGHAPCLGPTIAPFLCQFLTWASRRQPPRSPCACPSSRLQRRRILRDAQTWLTEPGAADC